MIIVFQGLPGSGKSLKLAQAAIDILYRNRKWHKKALKKDPTSKPRLLYTNLKLSTEVETEFAGYVSYWTDLRQLTPLRDVDVLIDEIATYFDARLWETLSLEMRRWLAQHRKFGIEIYGTTQDFAQVDKSFRRLTSNLLYLTKLFGSSDISPTRPNPRFIWGVSLLRELDPTVYDELKSKFQPAGLIPRFLFITRARTMVFDTRAEVRLSSALPLKHILKACELDNCSFQKTIHV